MNPYPLNKAIVLSSCPGDVLAGARGKNATVELLERLNSRRTASGLPVLVRYPSDRELIGYFMNGEESLKQIYEVPQ